MLLTALVINLVLANPTHLVKGSAASYPWLFANGNDTSRTMTVTTGDEIAKRAGYSEVTLQQSEAAWHDKGLPAVDSGRYPSASTLQAFGKAVGAERVLYGKLSWHTRSIWVNAGPKTISTATVTAFVFDVAKGRNVYSRRSVTGRSDERSNTLKIAASILFTPLVSAVSGGPATPQEQRAMQIAMSRAYQSWVQTSISR